jgi:hypothetical protein
MTAIALKQVEDCIEAYPPGGTRKTFFVRVKKVLTWAWREQYTATNLMAGTKSADNWRDNTEKMDLETFGHRTTVRWPSTAQVAKKRSLTQIATSFVYRSPHYLIR